MRDTLQRGTQEQCPRIKDYVFSMERMLSFESESGPYVQYTHARACSLINKYSDYDSKNVDFSLLNTEDEVELIKLLDRFSDTVINSLNKNEPSIITRYLADLARGFNRMYANTKIITEDAILTNTKLSLVESTKIVIKNGLALLTIKSPEKM